MFVYTIGDVLFLVVALILVVIAAGGFLMALIMDAVNYICAGVIWLFKRIFGRKGDM